MALSKVIISEIVRIVESVPKEDLAEFEQIVHKIHKMLNKRHLGKECLRQIPGVTRCPEDCELSGKPSKGVLVDEFHPMAQGEAGAVLEYGALAKLTSDQKIKLSMYEPKLKQMDAWTNLGSEIYDDIPQLQNWLVSVAKEIFPDIAERIDNGEEVFDGPDDVMEFLLFMVRVAKNEAQDSQPI